jgi:hypothetical protein
MRRNKTDPPAVEFDQSGIFLVVGDERAGHCGSDSMRRDVTQARAERERLFLAGAGRQSALGDCVAGEDDGDRGRHVCVLLLLVFFPGDWGRRGRAALRLGVAAQD